MTHLDKDIALVYQGVKVPDEAVFIVHGEQIARSKNCEHATINALKKLQEDAKKLGANAIVNLAPKWENESLRVGKNKYFCAGGAVTFGIKWEGDFVKIEKDEAPGKSSASDENASGPAEGSAEDSHPLEEEKEDIIVSITLEGKIVYEGKTVTRDFILGILEEKKKSDPDLKIILKADPKTPYGKVAELSVALSDAGFTNVKVMVDEN
jgi:biopolymer transport protein ExbD